jgi:putative ABC transport system permease protein
MEVGTFEAIDLWVPLTLDASGARRDDRSLRVTALLKPGVSFAQAATEMPALARPLEQAYPDTNAGWSARPLKLPDAIVGTNTWQILALLTIVVAFVLLVACANIANMMLARATAREKEMAVRVALGASRSRLLRQILTESLLLGLGGGVLGLAVARRYRRHSRHV